MSPEVIQVLALAYAALAAATLAVVIHGDVVIQSNINGLLSFSARCALGDRTTSLGR